MSHDVSIGVSIRTVAGWPSSAAASFSSATWSGGKEVATFKHPGGVARLAWRSDGKVFATGCYDHDIYLWDVANPAQPLRILKGHFGPVVNLAFSHGGDLLFSNSWDSTDRLWDPMTGQQLVSRPGGVYREHHFGPDDQGLDDGWQVATGRECRTFHGHKNHRVGSPSAQRPVQGPAHGLGRR